MLGKLVPCGGGPPIALLKPRLLVGRQPACDIPLSLRSVSGRHCELELVDGYWHVRDLDSTNGTRVNGTPCKEGWLLPNDVLSLAQYRYTAVYTPPRGQPPPPPQIAAPARREAEPPRQAARAPERAAGAPAGPGAALGELVPCGGGAPIRLVQPMLVVGRDDGCDIVLRYPFVSGRHCRLEWADGYWSVQDLGSRNGIRVDGVSCQAKRLLPGNVLWIAALRFRVMYSAPGAARSSLFGQSLLEKAGLVRWQPPEEPGPKRQTLDEPE
jgi:pSer/pThr/pTyr-binding forkhead associated (FHA) protein